MKPYESLYILNTELEQDAIDAVVEKMKEIIEKQGGEIQKLDRWGKKRLAYPIDEMTEGYYVLMQFDGSPESAKELERVQRISDEVVRFITVSTEDQN